MINLSYVEFQCFRSFKEKTRINFPEGATLLKGKYDDSEVGSGTGKSSVTMAIAYALDFSAPPATKLVNWYGKSKDMFVELGLIVDGEPVSIYRDSKVRKVTRGGAEYIGPEADRALDEIVKIDRKLAQTLSYRAQNTKGSFLRVTDAAKKEFLSPLIGTTEIEAAGEALSAEHRQLSQNVSALEPAIAMMANTAAGYDAAAEELARAELRYREAEAAMNAAKVACSDAPALKQKRASLQDELNKATAVQSKLQVIASENRGIRDKVTSLKEEAEQLRAATCPTCKREWDKFGDTLDRKKTEMANLIARMSSNLAFEKQAVAIVESIPKIRSEINELTNQLAVAESTLGPARDRLSMADQSLKAASRVKAQAEEARSRHEEGKRRLESMKERVAVLDVAQEMVGRQGFLSDIFSEVLAEVEDLANDMIAAVPNINTFSLRLSSTSTLKSGATKNSISAVLYKDDVEVDIAHQASGGQAGALDLCVDLAIRECIRRRSGSPIAWVCLDEVMDGLGAAEKHDVLEMIFQKISGQVVVIDHETKVQEGFASVIQIGFDGRNSRVIE